jgi:hypothetical protein
MPLSKEEDYGTNANGSKSHVYCFHCFQKGKYFYKTKQSWLYYYTVALICFLMLIIAIFRIEI